MDLKSSDMAKQWIQDNLWKIVLAIILAAGTGIGLNTQYRIADAIDTPYIKRDIAELKKGFKEFSTEQKAANKEQSKMNNIILEEVRKLK